MSEAVLALIPTAEPMREAAQFERLRSAVLSGVTAQNSKRNYANQCEAILYLVLHNHNGTAGLLSDEPDTFG